MKTTILIQEKTFEATRKSMKDNQNKTIIFSSDDDELNRKVLEKEIIQILLLNQTNRKDYSKQRNSGFNQVMAKIVKKNKINLGINLDEIISSKPKQKAEILARIKQNIKLCNKNNLPIVFVGKIQKEIYDLKALGLVLGISTKISSTMKYLNL
ncbi:MAG: hypothetical protein KKF48_00495 [Nanoarchaeota archaeon]|nr:hypothetical protein [Nanoarchaeota archaeon]MBU1027504.1 hypothetical protein [Nanoarchaeota archaeon]